MEKDALAQWYLEQAIEKRGDLQAEPGPWFTPAREQAMQSAMLDATIANALYHKHIYILLRRQNKMLEEGNELLERAVDKSD